MEESVTKFSDDEQEFEHESYGMVGFSRITGNPGRLFGSALPNQHVFIKLRLVKGSRRHALGRDWYHGEAHPIVEVDLSAAQFAEMLTSMNCGSGVPCTIRYADGKRIENPPLEMLESEQIRHDFKGKTEQVAKKLDASRKKIGELLEKKVLGQKDREEIKSLLGLIVQDVRSNLPFWQESFEEAAKKIVTHAKAEVDAFMTHSLMVAGYKAISEGKDTGSTIPSPALLIAPDETDS
jgi:hypothetical protein